ncbi:histidine phosphatase superfamily [Dactylonectria estremocensis]|uniref:Histidine phosphatase superfamily n=1 Tax=Dactylonectria estremocensis TaxID=1079267 RepID=A0A9P9JED2_9HYPO|nr:histidine phosphatase superfamily [Dactylonectria estremocensis]
MTKPRLIILIRHGQSEGNKNKDIHQSIPDHRVKLTPEGWNQAHDAGRRLRKLLRPDDTLQIFTSPYRRTRETTEGILSTLTSDEPDPSPFRRSNIKVYEEPRLREQDFGNFQPCSAEMERMWQERADYGHFFYRIPNGESAADAYDRISGFNESLWRQFGEDDFASVCVLVTHGLMSRVFLMKWYHFTVEYFEDLRNINHCEFLNMRKQDNGKYILENKLRTWSELRRERKDKEDREKTSAKLPRTKTFVATRRWGGCPNGCNHNGHYIKRDDLEVLRQKDHETAAPGNVEAAPNGARRSRLHQSTPAATQDDRIQQRDEVKRAPPIDASKLHNSEACHKLDGRSPSVDLDQGAASPYLHIGRDGGGTYSGHTSAAETDTDASEDEELNLHRVASLNTHQKSIEGAATSEQNGNELNNHMDKLTYADENGTSKPRRSNRLGDASPESSEGDPDDIDQAEKDDRSIQGSVY